MPTFGYTTAGGNTQALANNTKYACRFWLGERAEVTKITATLANGVGGVSVQAVIYDDLAGAPSALKGTSSSTTVFGIAWYDFTFSSPVTLSGGAYYWLGIIVGVLAAGTTYAYDAGSANQLAYKADAPPPSDPFGVPDGYQAREMSIYATYSILKFNRKPKRWVKGFRYCKAHAIKGSVAGAQTNYQVPIKCHYGSGTDSGDDVYLNKKCRTDFADVRFAKADGSLLDYWLEEKVNSSWALFWVEVDSIPQAGTFIYVYYGDPTASSLSSIANTWLKYYDPDDDVVGNDPTWDTVTEPANTNLEVTNAQQKFGNNSVLGDDFSGVNAYEGLLNISDYASLRVITWTRAAQTNVGGSAPQIYDGGVGTAIYLWFRDIAQIGYYDGAWKNLQAYVADTWYRLEIVSVLANGDFNVNISATTRNAGTWYNDKGLRGAPTAMDRVHWKSGSSTQGDFWYERVVVGKYVEPEPEHSDWGPEWFMADIFPLRGRGGDKRRKTGFQRSLYLNY